MKKYVSLIGLLFAMVLWSCGNAPDEAASPAAPETVVKQYQRYIDKNQFEEAKAISTPEEQRRLEELARIISQEMEASTIMNTRFLEIDCRTARDTARCYCVVEDEYERYETEFLLLRIRGRWLVDAPEGAGSKQDNVVDETLDSLFPEYQ